MPVNIPTAQEIERRIHLRLAGRSIPLTDLTTISAVRILIREAVIEELMLLWAGLARANRDWFLQTAAGEALDRRLADFGLTRPAARAATGTIEVTVDGTVTIPAGLRVRTEPTDGSTPKVYGVAPNADTPDGSYQLTDVGTVSIVAESAGTVGNTAAGTITVIENPVTGIVSVTNTAPVINGANAATDEEFRQYFRDYLQALKRGTRASLLFGIQGHVDPVTQKRVQSVALEEWGGQTLLDAAGNPVALKVYISEGSGAGTADATLVEAVQRLVDGTDVEADPGLRAAGVPTAVVSSQPRLVDVDVAVDIDPSANATTVRAAVVDAVHTYFATLPVGGYKITGELQGQLIFAQLFRAVMNVPGVLRAVFQAPNRDVAVPPGYEAVIRTLSVAVSVVSG